MRNSGIAVFGGLLIALAPSGQAAIAAQANAAASPVIAGDEAGVYSQLYDAIKSGIDDERILDQLIATFVQQVSTASPEIIKLEAQFPGLTAAIGEGVRPVFRSYRARLEALYRPKMIAAVKGVLTEAEARDATALYLSPVGRKLVGGVSAGFDGKATMASAMKDKDVSAAAVLADRDVAVQRGVSSLTPAEMAWLEQEARKKPGLLKLGQVGAATRQLNVAMESEPLTAAEEAEMKRSIDAAGAVFFAKFQK